MANCTLFVLSSSFEGLPGALIQAMACGAPVVSTDCPGGPAEIVSHQQDGLLVPTGDEEALAEAIESLLQNPRERSALADRARETARRFAVEPILQRYQEEILAVASRRHPPGAPDPRS